jgi:soluble lytic murein transglycosylase-like protein
MKTTVPIRIFAAALLASLAVVAHAGEQVTLANGFTLNCHHHAVVEGRIRLYTEPGETSYIEFAPTEVAAIESVPDPAPDSAAARPRDDLAATSLAAQGTRKRASSEAVSSFRPFLDEAGRAHNLDTELLASVVLAESGGNPAARSHAGARGLMQLMPGTAAELGVKDADQPEDNIRGGSAYLDTLLTRYHDDLSLALAAYNAGPAAVDKYHGIPPFRETRAYVARVIREFNRRVEARNQAARQQAATMPAN